MITATCLQRNDTEQDLHVSCSHIMSLCTVSYIAVTSWEHYDTKLAHCASYKFFRQAC